MKLLVLAALIVAASSGRLDRGPEGQQEGQQQWPWQAGKLYRYDIEARTLAQHEEGPSSGNAFRARFIVRVKGPGQLLAKLESPEHAQVHHKLDGQYLPKDLKYEPVNNLDNPFEITLDGGRVLSFSLPSTVSLPHENLLKGLISALQVDLSTYRNVRNSQDNYDRESHQGLFSKMESDVTGDCETLYTVAPIASEWRRELPKFASEEDPIEITKSKNYGHCHLRVSYHFGVPDGAEWTGTQSHSHHEEHFIKRTSTSRILVGKQGHIYKSETTSTANVHPLLFGKQKAQVTSTVVFELVSVEQDNEAEWQKSENYRQINNLLYLISAKQMPIPDESSSEESYEFDTYQEVKHREARSAKLEKYINIRKEIQADVSSSESNSAYINDEVPNFNEPAYAALSMSPQPRADMKQNKMNAQKLLKDIAQQLQNPNNMPKSDFLSKFNILVRIIASMTYEQLSQTSHSIEVTKSSNGVVEADMWMIYRDAVVQAGTLPAFQQIKSWIETKKIQEEEAAEVVTTLASTLRYPTREVMMQFFKLAISTEVQQQKALGTSALLSATKFINLGHVDNETAHSYYPTHMYGRLARKHDSFVLDEILPYLSKELKQAIERDDKSKAQVYIKAIGNLGHREILKIFTPYLEGKIPISTYLRVKMVYNLNVLALEKDKYVRAVLFSILKNTAEPYEVRVAAIHIIFMTHPSISMMQSMAEMTNDDPSIHVRASLKSAIEWAAELENPHFSDFRRNAEAVRELVTKEKFGYHLSTKIFSDDHEHEEEFGIYNSLSHIGSEDNLWPKSLRYSVRSKHGGWKRENSISASFSSVKEVFKFFTQQMSEQQLKQWETNHKYSADKISQMLNIKRDPKNPLEASLYIDLMNQQRFFTFDEKDLKQLPKDIKEYLKELENGVDKHYTKVLNQMQVSIMFPVAMGMPFIYKYNEPTVVHIQSKAKGQFKYPDQENREYSGNMDKELLFTYARNIDGSVGFLDTLTNQKASAGVINKLQVQLPVKLNIQMKSGVFKIRVEPLKPEQDTTLLHYSVWPYTASQKKDTIVPISQDPTTKVIERQRKIVNTDTKFGQSTGVQFQIQGYSYSSDYENLGSMFRSRNLLSTVVNFLSQRDVALTHYNFKHLGKQSQNKVVTFTAAYDELYNQKHDGEMGPAVNQQHVTPNNEERRKQMIKQVASGINMAQVQLIDVSATYEGAQKQEYVMTAALAHSPVDQKIQYVLFGGRNSEQGNTQVNSAGKVSKPETSALDLVAALHKELKMTFEADIKYGQGSGNVHIQGLAERSNKYTEALREHPQSKQCVADRSHNNHYQHECHKMIVMAHAPDHLKVSVTYKDMSSAYRTMFYQAYKIAEHFGFWYTEVNPLKVTPDGKLDIQIDASYIDRIVNAVLNTRYGEVKMRNVPIPKATVRGLAIYEPLSNYERVQNFYSSYQYQPYCSVDGTKIRTFSRRSYHYTLSRSWHVVMQEDDKYEQLVILARKPTEDKQEVYVSYKSESGKELEIEILPPQGQDHAQVKVKTNGKKISEGELTLYWDDVEEAPLLQYHSHKDGVLMLKIQPADLTVMYDGQRLVVISDKYRDVNRGICGKMSGEPRDDYLTPSGLVDKPEYYAASYSLNDESSDPKTKEQQEKAKQEAYMPKHKYTTILHSDAMWQSQKQAAYEKDYGSESVFKSRSYQKERGPCQLQQQVQYYENHGEICITTSPLPSCQSHCRGDGYREQAAQVTCRPKSDQEFRSLKDQIRQGQNPQVTGVPKVRQYKVPSLCKA